MAQGWVDALRKMHPGETIYTYWDFFREAFTRNAGLRIDHLLLNAAADARLEGAGVYPRRARLGKAQAITHPRGLTYFANSPRTRPNAVHLRARPEWQGHDGEPLHRHRIDDVQFSGRIRNVVGDR